ncbi:hypothetical protein G9272_01675 [Streptomyces asoensis]|uniref:Uncharacterized protein n=1 Tax=Streptomyces asoensis TaxID=249586 RepID=A0A6M4WFE4_9ACTN|nr:hypothetical protein G9272_01675 [Streptomyces asoensis]
MASRSGPGQENAQLRHAVDSHAGVDQADAAGVHEGHAAEVHHDPRRLCRAGPEQQGSAEDVLDVVVDLALHRHDTHATDHATLDGEPPWAVRLLDAGHRLLDCAWTCPD